jgi:hypothetical protein
MYACVCMCMCVCECVYVCIFNACACPTLHTTHYTLHTESKPSGDVRVVSGIHPGRLLPTHACTYTHIHPVPHIYFHTLTNAYIHTCIYLRTHTFYSNVLTQTSPYTYTRTHIQTLIRTHIHTHSHTHTFIYIQSSCSKRTLTRRPTPMTRRNQSTHPLMLRGQ